MWQGAGEVSELWGDHGEEQQGAGVTVHSCGMQQPCVSISNHPWPRDMQWPSKGMASITFKFTKAQGRQKRLETLKLALNMFITFLLEEIFLSLSVCHAAGYLGYSFPCPGDPTS